jgi:hypothetical protein
MIEVKKFHLIIALLRRNQGRRKNRRRRKWRKSKKVVASIKIKEQKPPVKTKKMTKPENKPAPKMVRKWVPKIATPTKSVDPK